jgi:hypothetical protein
MAFISGVEATGVSEGTEVKVFWMRRDVYDWQLCDSDEVVIAKGRAGSYADAKAEGDKQAKRLAKKK